MNNKLKAQGIHVKIKNIKYESYDKRNPVNITTMFFAYDMVDSKQNETILKYFNETFGVSPLSWEIELVGYFDEVVFNLVNDAFKKEMEEMQLIQDI